MPDDVRGTVRRRMECPSDDDLVRMLEGVLAESTLVGIESHVDVCERCASVVSDLGALISNASARAPDHPQLVAIDAEHYVLGDEIARGGMGRILRARDRRLGRQIAIKENFVSAGDGARRFEREAQVTARLQHPSIVHVYEAGILPTGAPFFAMQLVSGRSFDAVITSAATLDERLALVPNVLAVADAIAYAHSQSVIHRDLKPKNILVGDFGETVVIDWGLAKDLSEDTPEPEPLEPVDADGHRDYETEAGQVMGTPAYMPPEQALAKPVDRRADVYALGALLFHTLAGRPPVTGRRTAVLATITAGPLPSLADTQPGVPPDLLAIVAKAMAFSPADRYPSARELAEDLRRFQTGQLVGAHRYSPQQLLRRWLRRHRTAVTVAVVALALLAAIGVASIHQIVRAERTAQTERAAATRHRADAEELMSFMLGDLNQKLAPIGKSKLLALVAKKATTYYDRRSVEGALERHERARALRELGDVLWAQGNTNEALGQYRAAFVIAEALAVQDPTNTTWQRGLEASFGKLGYMLAARGDVPAALAESRAALAIAKTLAARDPNNADLQRDLAISHSDLGVLLATQGKPDELHTARGPVVNKQDAVAALVEYRAALVISQTLAAQIPGDGDRQYDVGVGHGKVGQILSFQGDSTGALAEYQSSLAIMENLVAQVPSNAVWQRQLSIAHENVGEIRAAQGDVTAALDEYRAKLAITAMLAARDPSNADWQRDVAVSHREIGDLLARVGETAAALAEFRADLAIAATLAAQDPSNSGWQHDLVDSHLSVGWALGQQKDFGPALAELRTCVLIAEQQAARYPGDADWEQALWTGHATVGGVLELQGDLAGMLAEDRVGMAAAEKLAARDPSNATWQDDLRINHRDVGSVFLRQGDFAGALAEFRAALAASESLAADNPSDADVQHDLADGHESTAEALAKLGQPAAALAEYRAALAIAEQLAAQDSTDARRRAHVTELRHAIDTCCRSKPG